MAILAGAALAAWLAPPLPESLSGLRTAGPYAALLAAAVVGAWFNRGRAFVLALSLLAAFAAYDLQPAKPVYTAFAVLVPLNALLALAFAERGARFGQAWKWLALIAAEAILVFVFMNPLSSESFLNNPLLRSPPTPFLARLLFGAAIAVAVARAWPGFSPLEVGLPAALAAFFVACEWVGAAGPFAVFFTAAGV